jgi:hypothetical protein
VGEQSCERKFIIDTTSGNSISSWRLLLFQNNEVLDSQLRFQGDNVQFVSVLVIFVEKNLNL